MDDLEEAFMAGFKKEAQRKVEVSPRRLRAYQQRMRRLQAQLEQQQGGVNSTLTNMGIAGAAGAGLGGLIGGKSSALKSGIASAAGTGLLNTML